MALFFIWSYAVKLRGGYLRFQAQYLRRIRLPDPTRLPPPLAADLRAAFRRRDFAALDELALRAYELPALPPFPFVDTRNAGACEKVRSAAARELQITRAAELPRRPGRSAGLGHVALGHEQKSAADQAAEERPDDAQEVAIKRALAQPDDEQRAPHQEQRHPVEDQKPAAASAATRQQGPRHRTSR